MEQKLQNILILILLLSITNIVKSQNNRLVIYKTGGISSSVALEVIDRLEFINLVFDSKIISPCANEKLIAEQKYNIEFSLDQNYSKNIKIEYSTDNGVNWVSTPILNSCANEYNSLYFEWTVPNINSEEMLLRLTDCPSDRFVISSKFIIEKANQEKVYYYPSVQNPLLKFKILTDGVWITDENSSYSLNQTVIVNDFLKMKGDIQFTSTDEGIKLISNNLKIYFDNKFKDKTNFLEDELVLYEGDVESLLDNLQIKFNMLDSKDEKDAKSNKYLGFVKFIPNKLEFSVKDGSIIIDAGGEAWFKGTKNCTDRRKRVSISGGIKFIYNLLTDEYDYGIEAGIEGLGFGFSDLEPSYDLCVNSLMYSYDSQGNEHQLNGNIRVPLINNSTDLIFGVGLLDGCLNNAELGFDADIGIPIATSPFHITGFTGSLDGICEPPLILSFDGNIEPMVNNTIPGYKLMELNCNALFQYKYGDKENKVLLGAGAKFIQTTAGSSEWAVEGELGVAWFYTDKRFDITGSFNAGKINDSYVFTGDGKFSLSYNQNNPYLFANLTVEAKLPNMTPITGEWYDVKPKAVAAYNKFIAGKTFAELEIIWKNQIIVADFGTDILFVKDYMLKYNLNTKEIDLINKNMLAELDLDIPPKLNDEELLSSKSETYYFTVPDDVITLYAVIKKKSTDADFSTIIIDSKDSTFTETDSLSNIYFENDDSTFTAFWIVESPISGSWSLTIDSIDNIEDVKFLYFKDVTSLDISIQQSFDTVNVFWDNNSNVADSLSFFLSTDSLTISTFIGFDSVSSGNFSFVIPTGLTQNKYYLCAKPESEQFMKTYFAQQPIINKIGLLHPTGDSLLTKPVIFRWEKYPSANTYTLECSKDSAFFDVDYVVPVSDTTAELNMITIGKHYWRVKAVKETQSSSWSEIWNFETEPDKHQISLTSGWNLISTYVEPDDSMMDDVFSEIEGSTVIVKNNEGQIYYPEFEINDIGDWDVKQGYQVYMSQSETLSISGMKIVPEDTPIALNAGWNMIAYLRDNPMDIEIALASLVADNKLIIAKDNMGNVFYPAFEINMIGDMLPGQGYQIYMISGGTLVYPGN